MTRDNVVIQAETFRILKSNDNRNWILEEWKEGGISPKTGLPSEGYWDNKGYFGKPQDLIKRLVINSIEVPEGTLQTQLRDLLIELKRVEQSIINQLKAA